MFHLAAANDRTCTNSAQPARGDISEHIEHRCQAGGVLSGLAVHSHFLWGASSAVESAQAAAAIGVVGPGFSPWERPTPASLTRISRTLGGPNWLVVPCAVGGTLRSQKTSARIVGRRRLKGPGLFCRCRQSQGWYENRPIGRHDCPGSPRRRRWRQRSRVQPCERRPTPLSISGGVPWR